MSQALGYKAHRRAVFILGEAVRHLRPGVVRIKINSNICGLLKVFAEIYPLGATAMKKAVIGLTKNDHEPDVANTPQALMAAQHGDFPSPF